MPITSDVFVDTSGWAEPLMRNSPTHPDMERHYQQLISIVNAIKQIPHLSIVYADRALDDSAWTLLERHDDKTWSLVDAASFVVMRQLSIGEAFTTDKHFVQAGFIRVPIR